jgi:hypothetical protein
LLTPPHSLSLLLTLLSPSPLLSSSSSPCSLYSPTSSNSVDEGVFIITTCAQHVIMKWEQGKIKLCTTTPFAELKEIESYDDISQVFKNLKITELYNGNHPFVSLPF